MKKKNLITAGILILSLCVPSAAWAGETPEETGGDIGSLLGSLFSEDGPMSGLLEEDGPLSGIIPEDVEIGEVIGTIGEQMQDAGSQLYQTIDGALDLVRDEDGSVDPDKVKEFAGDLFGMYSGMYSDEDWGAEGSDYDEELEELLRRYDVLDDAMAAYLFERNAEFLDPGDVQIYSKQVAYMDDIDLDEIKVLADFCQMNYTIEEDQLIMLSGSREPLLLTLAKTEDGGWIVTDEKHTEDGEGFADSLALLCEEVDLTTDDYYSSMVLGAYNDADALAEYMEEHPEITGAEFMGEICTAEELRDMSDAYIDELFDSIFGEDSAEEEYEEDGFTEDEAQEA